jgi:hypothetical protein
LLDNPANNKEERSVKKDGFLLSLAMLALALTFMVSVPQLATSGARAYARDGQPESKIISDTLAAHKVTCLSKDGTIVTVLLNNRWVDVREVELVDHTLILRTDAGTLSLAAVKNSP